MKTIATDLAVHLTGEVTTLATCWKITRRDGVILGFTDHIRDLEIGALFLWHNRELMESSDGKRDTEGSSGGLRAGAGRIARADGDER